MNQNQARIIHTTKKHKIQAIIAMVLSLVIIFGAILGVYFYFNRGVKIGETNFDPTLMNATIKPQGETLVGIIIPDADDADAQKALAIQLINIANSNLKNDDKVAYAVNTNTEVMGVPTGGIRYYIKNDNEFFNADYFYVPKGGIGAIAKAASPEYTNYGYRMYYNVDLGKGCEQKAKELSFEKECNGSLRFGVNWDDLYFENSIKDVPAEFAASEKPYRYYNYDWTEESILTALVTYNAKDGYYEMKVTIDCENEEAIQDGLKVLKEGAGDKDAVYTSITETVQIWDNGRYKQFNTYDEWHSPHIHGMRISADSANDYKTTFYYDEYSLTISNYQYSTDFIEYVKSK